MVREVKGIEKMSMLGAGRGAGREGAEGWRLRLTRSAEALAIMCPTLFLRLLKKAARLEKHSLGWAALADPLV